VRPDYRFPPKPVDRPDHISVLIPTRARPEKLKKVFECFQATVENKLLVDIWLYVDDDDEITLQYIKTDEWQQYEIKINWYIGKATKSMGDMLNQLWQKCTTNPGIYFPFCDDYILETPRWDLILRDFMARHKDGIMLGYLIDPQHASYQVTIPVPSAQWLNVLGYYITNRFYFWFDDMWLDRIAAMAQRKVLIPIRIISLAETGKTPRMKNLPFWNRYFSCTIDDRFEDAKNLINAIHKNDPSSLETALKNARETAAIQIHKSNLTDLDSERNAELVLSDPEYAPSASQLISYFEVELFAVEDLLQKVKKAMERSELSDALFLLDTLEFSSFNLPDINYIKATLFQDSGNYSSAAESLYKHIDKNPDDVKSAPRYNLLKNKLTEPDSINSMPTYLSAWLGVMDDYFIFFPHKIDEEIYFIVQTLIYFAQNIFRQFDSILVVGAGSGEGTVQAICSANRDVKTCKLFCIEPDKNEFIKLENSYSDNASLYNCSSVTTDKYISEKELAAFYRHIPSVMNKYPLETFIAALNKEKQYLITTNCSCDCIQDIKLSHKLDRFDLVVLDGSLFSGEADLEAVYGSRFILLTSVNSVKDYANHKRLSEDDNYQLATCNLKPRAGYSLFQWIGK
jgi:tetratricopeptide (TPR) repeat protein